MSKYTTKGKIRATKAKPARRKRPRTRAAALAKEQEALEVVLTRRCRAMGIPITPENMAKVRSPEYGTVLGLLCLSGGITAAQRDAGTLFADVEADWRRTQGLPPRSAGICGYGASRGGAGEVGESEAERARARYRGAKVALESCGVQSRVLVEMACLDDEPIPTAPGALSSLGQGLSALADCFHIKSDNSKAA